MTRGYRHIKNMVASASVTLWVEYEEVLVKVLIVNTVILLQCIEVLIATDKIVVVCSGSLYNLCKHCTCFLLYKKQWCE